jgi:hypothetical protein
MARLKVLMSYFHDLVLFSVHYGLSVEIEIDFPLVDTQHDTQSLLPTTKYSVEIVTCQGKQQLYNGEISQVKSACKPSNLEESFIIHDPEILAQNTSPISIRENNVDKYDLTTK